MTRAFSAFIIRNQETPFVQGKDGDSHLVSRFLFRAACPNGLTQRQIASALERMLQADTLVIENQQEVF